MRVAQSALQLVDDYAPCFVPCAPDGWLLPLCFCSLDDATYATLSSLMLFNNVDVVLGLYQDAAFLPRVSVTPVCWAWAGWQEAAALVSVDLAAVTSSAKAGLCCSAACNWRRWQPLPLLAPFASTCVSLCVLVAAAAPACSSVVCCSMCSCSTR